jgi:hypothetical protein
LPSASRCVHDARLAGGASGSTQSSWNPPVQHVSVRSKLERVALLVKVSTLEAERERAGRMHLSPYVAHIRPRASAGGGEDTERYVAFAPFAETLRTVCARALTASYMRSSLYTRTHTTRTRTRTRTVQPRARSSSCTWHSMGVGAHHPLTGASASDPPGCSSAPGPVARRGGPARSGRAPGPSRARGSHSAATPTAAVRKRV